jgi:HTH-type transcriptional regulator, sugar sensing transcriptional regulator
MSVKTELLEEIGLTKSEIKAYLALLELGSVTTGKIVEKSKVASSKIYEVLDKLIHKGLVSYIIKSGIKYFEAANPKRIMDYVKEREEKLKKQENELKELIPQLELKKQLSDYKSEAQIYRGMKGLHTAFYGGLDTLKKNDELMVMGIPKRSKRANLFFIRLNKERVKRGIRSREICDESAKDDMQAQPENNPLSQVRFLPTQVTTPSATTIFKDRVIIFPAETEKEPLLIVIDNKEVADSFRNQFELLWNQEVTISKGMAAMKKELYENLDNIDKGDCYEVYGAAFGSKNEGNIKSQYINFFKEFHKYRVSKGIKAKLLFQQGMKTDIHKYRPELLFKEKAQVKYLPYKTESPVAIYPYKNKTRLLVQEKEPIMITINNKEVTKSFKKNFDLLWKQDVKIVRGLSAIQDLFEEFLEHKHADFIGARGYFMDKRPKFVDGWEKRAIKKGFTMRNIVDSGTKGHRITKFPFVETKYNISKEFSTLSVYWIFGNKVAISNWMEKEPIAVIIENKNIHNMYKEQFEQLWNQQTTTYKGNSGIKLAFQELVEELNPNDEIHIMGVHDFGKDFLSLALFFQKIRSEKKIKAKFLINEEAKHIADKFKKYPPIEIKFVNKKLFTPAIFIISKNKVIINLPKEKTFFVIKSKGARESFETYFQLMWKKERKN